MRLTDQKLLAHLATADSNVGVRCAAAEQLTDQAVLAQIAAADSDAGVRRTAVDKLTDQALLTQLAEAHSDTDVRRAAVQKLTDQAVLKQYALADSDAGVRRAAAETLTDQAVLAQVAAADDDADVRRAAVGKLTGHLVLTQIAAADSNAGVRRLAAERLTDQAVLARVAASDNDAGVRRLAVEKLTDHAALARVAAADNDADVRRAALKKLTSIREKAQQIMRLLRDECENAARSHRLRNTGRLLEDLVGLGPGAIPVIVDVINSVVRQGTSNDDWIGNASNLCTAIGRLGGPEAFDLLAHYALADSNNPVHNDIRSGAIKGLAQLGDQRGREVLQRVLIGFAGFEEATREALQRLGVTDPAILTAAPPWHAGVNLRDPIAMAHAFQRELRKESPDYAEFKCMIEALDKSRQYTAWHELAAYLEGHQTGQRGTPGKSRKLQVAGQCWVQALCCQPSPSSFNWPALAHLVVPPELEGEFKRCYTTWGPSTDQAPESERIAMARRLELLVGRPGETREAADGSPVDPEA